MSDNRNLYNQFRIRHGIMKLGTTQTFSAAHKLPRYEGNCANLHGHTWKAEIIIKGEIDIETGMIIDFRAVKDLINALDHSYLNDLFENPTCEHITEYLADQITNLLSGGCVTVKLYESETTWCESTKYSTA